MALDDLQALRLKLSLYPEGGVTDNSVPCYLENEIASVNIERYCPSFVTYDMNSVIDGNVRTAPYEHICLLLLPGTDQMVCNKNRQHSIFDTK